MKTTLFGFDRIYSVFVCFFLYLKSLRLDHLLNRVRTLEHSLFMVMTTTNESNKINRANDDRLRLLCEENDQYISYRVFLTKLSMITSKQTNFNEIINFSNKTSKRTSTLIVLILHDLKEKRKKQQQQH